MKQSLLIVVLQFCGTLMFAQNTDMLIRHDTTMLKSGECEWIVKSLVKNDPGLTPQLGKSVPLIILQAIEKGKIKAYDKETNNMIPPKEIRSWHMPADTVARMDNEGNIAGYVVVKQEVDANSFPQIRVFHDWYVDITTGKISSQVKWIELMQEIKAPDGTPRGSKPYCRIYY